jgi:hypothetical protein
LAGEARVLLKERMPILLIVLVLLASAAGTLGGVMPLTAKEVGLMLRAGYSSEAVLRDLSTRRFADAFNSTIEKQLTEAGANAALLEALRSGTYQLTPAEFAKAEQKLSTRQAEVTETSRPSATASQEQPAARRPSAPDQKLPDDAVYRLLRGDLVYYHHGSIVHFDDETLGRKKLYLFLFSSNGSKPGRQLTARLVEYYNRVASQYPEFEVIFFSADRTQFGMETCMTQGNMPWPAVAYDKVGSKIGMIPKDLVREIPCLVLADAGGRILSHSGAGENDSNPEKVLADLDRILAHGRDALTQTH